MATAFAVNTDMSPVTVLKVTLCEIPFQAFRNKVLLICLVSRTIIPVAPATPISPAPATACIVYITRRGCLRLICNSDIWRYLGGKNKKFQSVVFARFCIHCSAGQGGSTQQQWLPLRNIGQWHTPGASMEIYYVFSLLCRDLGEIG